MENGEIVIKVTDVSKKFAKSLRRSMLYGTADMARNFLGIVGKQSELRKSEFWALKDVNFELRTGETLGIVGVNGSGKSTLLRVLNGIFPPDTGEVMIKGKIGALIAVGAGFHPHMTGRENVYLNGTILGMTHQEIEEKFDSIVGFAEIGEFLDAPVSTYSSGMRVRLGFAIAIHCEPDILLVDEILSVGDIGFRNKSLRYMSEYRRKANAIIFISHDIEQVRVLCSRVIILDAGKVAYDGDTAEGLVQYEEMSRRLRLESMKSEIGFAEEKIKKGISDSETLNVIELGVMNDKSEVVDSIGLSGGLKLFCEFELKRPVSSLSFYVSLRRDDTEKDSILLVSNDTQEVKFKHLEVGRYRVVADVPEHHLAPGVYNPNIGFRNDETFETYCKIYSNIPFIVRSDGHEFERGMVNVKRKWELLAIN